MEHQILKEFEHIGMENLHVFRLDEHVKKGSEDQVNFIIFH